MERFHGNTERKNMERSYGNAERKPDPLVEINKILDSFYSNPEKKEVKPLLFSDTAKKIARLFTDGPGIGVSKTQLRRLYDEVKRLEQNLGGKEETKEETWKKTLPYIKMIESKTIYNTARAIEKSSREKDVYNWLSAFITRGLFLAKDEEDYHVFSSLFEAVYGFYYKEAIDKGIRGN